MKFKIRLLAVVVYSRVENLCTNVNYYRLQKLALFSVFNQVAMLILPHKLSTYRDLWYMSKVKQKTCEVRLHLKQNRRLQSTSEIRIRSDFTHSLSVRFKYSSNRQKCLKSEQIVRISDIRFIDLTSVRISDITLS